MTVCFLLCTWGVKKNPTWTWILFDGSINNQTHLPAIPRHHIWVTNWREYILLPSPTDWPNSTVDLPAICFQPNRTRRYVGALALQVSLIVGGAGDVTETRDWNTKKGHLLNALHVQNSNHRTLVVSWLLNQGREKRVFQCCRCCLRQANLTDICNSVLPIVKAELQISLSVISTSHNYVRDILNENSNYSKWNYD